MNWIKLEDQIPTMKDLPFITYRYQFGGDEYEIWEDSDWFEEYDDNERFQWTHWMKLEAPK